MRSRFRLWLCRKFNLIGLETTITVKRGYFTYISAPLEIFYRMDQLKRFPVHIVPESLAVKFDWKPEEKTHGRNTRVPRKQP